jgi:hypothetical protein
MRSLGLEITQQYYGFSGVTSDSDGDTTYQCGLEYDGSISLCVNYPSGPPNRWFFRNSMDDMVAFIIDAHDRLKNGECETFRTALESIDPGITPQPPSA